MIYLLSVSSKDSMQTLPRPCSLVSLLNVLMFDICWAVWYYIVATFVFNAVLESQH